MSDIRDSLVLPDSFEAARVPDSRFARAYAQTGETGRALIKSQIAALHPSYAADYATSVSVTARLHGGQVRTIETTPRPWHLLVIAPGVAAPAHLVAAVLPAVARRIPVLAVRSSGKGGWPPALLAALELCGVEQVFSMSLATLKRCLKSLTDAVPGGSVAMLGAPPLAPGAPAIGGASVSVGRPFHERVRAVVPAGVVFHVHEPPALFALLEGQGIDEDAVTFAHAGVPVRRLASPGALAQAFGASAQDDPRIVRGDGADSAPPILAPASALAPFAPPVLAPACACAVFAPPHLAPASARVVLAPGRESVWEWPDAPAELFITRRLVYS